MKSVASWRSRHAFIGMLVAASLLSACSSKPESEDIARELSPGFQCDQLQVTDFKKVNGASAQDGLYEVAYTFKAEIKGGKDAAAKYLEKLVGIDAQIKASDKNLRQVEDETMGSRMQGAAGVVAASDAPDALKQARAQNQQLRDQRFAMMSCGNLESQTWVQHLKGLTVEAMASGKTEIPLPIGLQMQGNGLMKKAESGWVFVQAEPHSVASVIQSDPVKFPSTTPAQ